MSRDGSIETWSREITTPDELSGGYASAIRNIFTLFPYCVRTPPDRSFHESSPEQLLCLAESKLALLMRRRGVVSSVVQGLDAIDVLESETTLLSSRLRIYPRAGEVLSIHYNSVCAALFHPFVAAYQDFHGSAIGAGEALCATKPNPFHYLMERDYRYHSYVFDVLRGDTPRAHFYHPAVKVPVALHRWRIISSYLLVASASLLYCLSEEPPLRSSRRAEYSIMFRYLPLSRGLGLELRAAENEERFSWLAIRSGSTTFRIPVATEERTSFEVFRRSIGLE